MNVNSNEIPIPMIILNKDNTIKDINDKMKNLIKELDGEDTLHKCLMEALEEKEFKKEVCVNCGGVNRVYELITKIVDKKDFGDFYRIIVVNDITTKRKMEEEIIKNEKLKSISNVASELAHDFNNILSIILANTSLIKLYMTEEDVFYEKFLEIERAAKKGSDLAKQLLIFSKSNSLNRKKLNLKKLLIDTTRLSLSGTEIKSQFNIDDNLMNVEGDEGQISQVITNIVINASHAMNGKGILEISAKNMDKYVQISIEDEGEGISKEHISKIFEPYFTTKKDGTGIGLASVDAIIRRHDGYINVESEKGKGSIFKIYLKASDIKKEVIAGKGKILVMDDDKEIRKVVSLMLSHIGYDTVVAKDGESAVKFYKEHNDSGEPFGAVILDLNITEGMGAKETIEKLMKIDRNVKGIVSSGYVENPIIKEYKKYGFKAAAMKPYTIEYISEILNDVLLDK